MQFRYLGTITAKDKRSMVKEIRYAVNDGQEVVAVGSTVSATISYEHDNNTIMYYAVDEWGNAEAPRLVDGIKLDKTPPVVRLWLDPAKDEYYSDELLPVKHEAYDPVVQGTPSNDLALIFDIDGIPVEDPTDVSKWIGTHVLTLTATDAAGNSASASVTFNAVLRAEVNIDPDTLNLKSEGKWITAYIEFPVQYDVMSIKIDTVTLNSTIRAENDPKYDFVTNPQPVDKDGDGLLEFVVKFDRSAVAGLLSPRDEAMLTVSGEMSEGFFEGSDSIRVIREGKLVNRTDLRVQRHIVPRGNAKDGSEVGVNIDVFTLGIEARSVHLKEYIPRDFAYNTPTGVFVALGLAWDIGDLEPGDKSRASYALVLPIVEAPTTYEFKTVVEYQTEEDFEVIEIITYLTVDPKNTVLKEGNESRRVEKGSGYSHGNMGRRYSRGGSSDNHGKGHGKPENPGRGNPPDSPPDGQANRIIQDN